MRELISVLENRDPPSQCRIRATNDVEAIERWLDEYFEKPTTFRTYKKEAERFFVWCVKARKTNFSRLDRDDVEAYVEFLKNPSPREIWCGPRRKKSGDEKSWYPFLGPLSESAIKTALASLTSLMAYLVDARYIEMNPFTLIRRKSRFKQQMDEQSFKIHERILDETEWRAILETIEEQPNSSTQEKFKAERLRFLVAILFFLGLRIDELAKATWSGFYKQNDKWWFLIRGKGDRLGKIPVNSYLLHAIMRYRHATNKTPLPAPLEDGPVIFGMQNETQALSSRQVSNLLKELAVSAAKKFPSSSQSHHKLLRFSPHWLRHLSASRQDLAGISITNIKANLRHQSEQTTRIYVHAYDEERHHEMEKLTF